MQEIFEIVTALHYRFCKWRTFRYDSGRLRQSANHLLNSTGYLRDYLEYLRNEPSTSDIAGVLEHACEVTVCLINYRLWLGQILPLSSNRKQGTLVVHYNAPFQQRFWQVVFFLLDYESRCLCLRYWTRHRRQPTIYDVIPQVCTYPGIMYSISSLFSSF